MGLTTYADAIRGHFNTNFSAAVTASGTWGTVAVDWESVDQGKATPKVPPVPKPTDWQNTSFVRFKLDPNINPWISSGYVAPEGFVIVQCFTPQNIGPEPCEALAKLVADQFRTTKRTFSSGAGVFRPAEVKQIGPDDNGFFQYNVRVEFRFQEAA